MIENPTPSTADLLGLGRPAPDPSWMDKVVQDGPSTRGLAVPAIPRSRRSCYRSRRAAPHTVTVANPTPPTNIAYVSYGTGPVETMTPNPAGRGRRPMPAIAY